MRRRRRLARLAAGLLLVALAPARAEEAPKLADVVAVNVTGEPGRYVFAVTLRSPDVSCDRYANWWEVVSTDGTLVYRRILMHSHPTEQPFTRRGGPVEVQPDDVLVVRSHLHPRGYGGAAFRGSVSGGFERWNDAPDDFAAQLAQAPPQPRDCWR